MIFTRISAIVFFLFIWGINSYGQKIISSQNNLDDFSLGYTKVIGQDETGYFVTTNNFSYNTDEPAPGFRSKKFKVAYFSKSLDKKWSVNLNPHPAGSNIESIEFFSGKFVYVCVLENKATGSLSVYLNTISKEGVVTFSDNPIINAPSSVSTYQLLTSTSLKRSMLGIVLRQYGSDDAHNFTTACLNSDFIITGSAKGTINQPRKSFGISDVIVSESGTIFFLGLKEEKTRALSAKRDYKWFLHEVQQNMINSFEIGSGYEITGLSLAFDEFKLTLTGAGFYNDRNSFVGSGIVYFK
jgi:hypothetical protein